MKLNRESPGSNYDVFLFLLQFLIWISDRSVCDCVTSQNAVYVIRVTNWSPRYWDHGWGCFVGSKDVFGWSTWSCNRI